MYSRPLLTRFAALLFLLLTVSCGITAQDHVRGDQIPPGASQQGTRPDEPTFRVHVRLVNVFTTVTDAHGSPVADLTKDDFKVLEDGVPQTISVFERESELPLS